MRVSQKEVSTFFVSRHDKIPLNMSVQSPKSNHPLVMERLTRLEDADRSFDIEFWQRLGDAAICAAAWEMVVFAHEFKGRDASELAFQRTLKKIQRTSS